jgi:hypothetical protein
MKIMTTKSIVQKINRSLKGSEETLYWKLCKSRGISMKENCGEYYLLDTYTNTIIYLNVDPVDYIEELSKP